LSNRTPNRHEVAILLAPQLGNGEAAYRFDVAQVVADLVQIALRQFANVVAAVAVFRQRRMLAQQELRAHPHRDREILDLLAGIVVVELAGHRGALPLDEPGQRIAQCALAAMADVQRARRIRRDEFDHHALAGACIAAAESLALGEDVPDHRLPRGGRDEDVDEPGACYIDFLHEIRLGQRRNQRLRKFARIALQRLRMLKRDVRCEVAVLRLLGALEFDSFVRAIRRDFYDAQRQELSDQGAQIGHNGL
jgi:hypothetical protein